MTTNQRTPGWRLVTSPGKYFHVSLPPHLLSSAKLTDTKSGGTGLWYTGCYISSEDACLEDQLQGTVPFLNDSTTFDDSKALTIKNVTVSSLYWVSSDID